MPSALSRNWWATVARGIIAIAIGIFAWARPDICWASLPPISWRVPGIAAGLIVVLYPDRAGTAIVLVIGL